MIPFSISLIDKVIFQLSRVMGILVSGYSVNLIEIHELFFSNDVTCILLGLVVELVKIGEIVLSNPFEGIGEELDSSLAYLFSAVLMFDVVGHEIGGII